MRWRGCRLEVDSSLWVFREIWAREGRQFGIVVGDVNLGKGHFINELAVHKQHCTEEARYGWLAVGSQENSRNANKSTVRRQTSDKSKVETGDVDLNCTAQF